MAFLNNLHIHGIGVGQFLSIQAIVRLRRSCSKCANPYTFFNTNKECFFWYTDGTPEDSDDDTSTSDDPDNRYSTLHFCRNTEEVVSQAKASMACQTITSELNKLLVQLSQQGCKPQEQLWFIGDDEDTTVRTRHLGFRIARKKHFRAVFHISWECNSTGDEWATFIAGPISSSFLRDLLNAVLAGDRICVQGEYCTRRKSQIPFSWKYRRRLDRAEQEFRDCLAL